DDVPVGREDRPPLGGEPRRLAGALEGPREVLDEAASGRLAAGHQSLPAKPQLVSTSLQSDWIARSPMVPSPFGTSQTGRKNSVVLAIGPDAGIGVGRIVARGILCAALRRASNARLPMASQRLRTTITLPSPALMSWWMLARFSRARRPSRRTTQRSAWTASTTSIAGGQAAITRSKSLKI